MQIIKERERKEGGERKKAEEKERDEEAEQWKAKRKKKKRCFCLQKAAAVSAFLQIYTASCRRTKTLQDWHQQKVE